MWAGELVTQLQALSEALANNMSDPLIEALLNSAVEDSQMDPYMTAARAFNQPIEWGADASPWAKAGGMFVQSLLGGAAEGIGTRRVKNNFEDRSKRVLDYQGFSADPTILADSLQHDKDPIISALAPAVRMGALEQQKARAAKLQGFQDEALGAGLKKTAEITAENTANGGMMSPKDLRELADKSQLDINKSESASSLNSILTAKDNITALLGQKGITSDVAAISMLAKLLDPRSTVRESEFTVLADPGSPAMMLQSYLQKLKGGGPLTDDKRAEIMQMIDPLVSNAHSQYVRYADPVLKYYESRGGKRGDIFLMDAIKQAQEQSAGQPAIAKTKTPGGRIPTKEEFMRDLRATGAIK